MIKLIIAEDQGLLSSALATILGLEDDLDVVGIAKNGVEALELIEKHQPDICLTDIEMPLKTGLDIAEELQYQKQKVIILTTFAREGYFERAVKAEVSGYLLKDTPTDELIGNIRAVMQGKKFYSPELVTGLFSQQENPLTEREQEVLLAVGEGLSSKEIAEKLFLTAGTVRNYMSEILSKLDAKNRIEAVSIAKEKGWI
ncbi:DNA-binding response regulator [Enterococcus ureilyticus]|uniref:DNA-binding response regulator n=1 Tax=Enterococcus ureilyticus TaxID=1131292 RepID=A0A1E5HBI8_9ENTE|nr:response regulator transcription factor [Enterococcus ureilyticus]MBM7689201.1 two-component system response regulator DesR [Enterococcus ureilyticus]MBO0445271.1 response regulator transcription factor [Enterococcus ureilyticus]OEG22263.1 DNA-binding response regulator [Enterococcus ureilyticus]